VTFVGGMSSSAAPAPRGRAAVSKRGRRQAGQALRDFVIRVLRQSPIPMSPKKIAAAVKGAGYRTSAKDLTKAVSNVIPQVNGVKRVGFGEYSMN